MLSTQHSLCNEIHRVGTVIIIALKGRSGMGVGRSGLIRLEVIDEGVVFAPSWEVLLKRVRGT